MKIYESIYRGTAKAEAQAHLSGRTHYVDDGTLAYFHARILSVRRHYGGRILSIIESVAADYQNTRREFRHVIFDVCGNVVERPASGEGFRTARKAEKARDAWLDTLGEEGAAQITRAALAGHAARLEREAEEARAYAHSINTRCAGQPRDAY